jgi:hypothetical protein
MTALGHSRPNHRGPKSTDVRYAPKATIRRYDWDRPLVIIVVFGSTAASHLTI